MNSLSHRTLAKASASVALAAAAVVAGPAASAFAIPAFYTPPATLPAANGALVRSEPMKLTFPLSGTGTRIMYKSTDTNGNPIAVTGTYIEPSTGWTGSGPRPVVSYAEGTQGQGDKCAPSFGLESILGGGFGSTNVNYEFPGISNLLNRGFSVVVTDYMGLGTPGIHTYVNRVDQGRAVLDAARAAKLVSGSSVTAASPVAAFGYSQGGGAAASAAELAPTYAPDLNLKGAYAGAPPADLNAVMKTADGTALTGVIGFAINGFVDTYPAVKSVLDANINAAGRAALAKIGTECIIDAIGSYGFQKTSKWTNNGQTVAQIVTANPAAKAVIDAQTIGKLKPAVPVRITTGTRDDIVTHSQVKQLATDWCSLGANVTYVPVRQYVDSYGTVLNHLGPSFVDASGAQKWIADRLTGVATQSNCSSVSSLP